jgi:hypothetical protein
LAIAARSFSGAGIGSAMMRCRLAMKSFTPSSQMAASAASLEGK